MARIRSIKPEFPESESMGRVSRDARLLFILLWTAADDVGRLRGNSRMLASRLLPYDEDAPSLIDVWLSELVREKSIAIYKVDGQTYIQICNWLIHQKIDRPSKSKIPPIDQSLNSNGGPHDDSRVSSEDSRVSSEDSRVSSEDSRVSSEDSSEEGSGRDQRKGSKEGRGEEAPASNPLADDEQDASSLHPNVLRLFDNPGQVTYGSQRVPYSSEDKNAFVMHVRWRPSRDAIELLRQGHVEITSHVVFDKAVAEFISYWRGKDTKRTQADWDHAFAKHIFSNGLPKDPNDRGFVC